MINVNGKEVRVHETMINSPNILVLIQGSCMPYNQVCNIAVKDAIIDAGIASVIMYDSSRDWDALETADTNPEWRAAFDGKTFQDELREARALFYYVNDEYSPDKLFLSGRSYGGSLGALIAGDRIENLERVMLTSPQLFFSQDEELPNIYQNAPAHEEILESIAHYSMKLRIVSGLGETEEFIVGARELFRHAGIEARPPRDKEWTILDTDHTSSDDPTAKPLTYHAYVKQHLDFFGQK